MLQMHKLSYYSVVLGFGPKYSNERKHSVRNRIYIGDRNDSNWNKRAHKYNN